MNYFRAIVVLMVILYSKDGFPQMKKWVLGNSQQNSSGSFYSLSPGNLQFFEVDFTGTSPVFTPRVLGASVNNIVSVGTQDVINSAVDSSGNILFYLFTASLSPYNIPSTTIDTFYFVAPSSVTGKDEVFAKIAAGKRVSSVIEHGFCRHPTDPMKFYFVYKTSSGSLLVDDVCYITIDLATMSISSPITLVDDKSSGEGFAISPFSCKSFCRWLYTASIEPGGNISLWKYAIDALGVHPPTLAYSVSIASNAGVTVIGGIEISPQGDKLALCNYNVFDPDKEIIVLDLDLSTGNLSNERFFVQPDYPLVACEFSSDGSRIYMLQSGSGSFPSKLYHHDVISSGSYALSVTDELPLSLDAPLALERAFDNKIYGIVGPNKNYFYSIDNINSPSPTVSYTSSIFYGTAQIGDGLPDVAEDYPGFGEVNIIGQNAICFGDSLWLSVNAAPNDTIEWTGASLGFGDSILVSPSIASVYFVEVIDEYCTLSDSLVIQVYTEGNASISVGLDTCKQVYTFSSYAFTNSYSWDFGDGNISSLSPVEHSYASQGNYNVELVVNPGTNCADTAFQNIDVQFLGNDENIFPNVITPNNDGLNDELRFGAFCGYNHIAIFDRWGVEVFNADVQSGLVWNGTDKKGKALSEGVYYYCLSGGNVESYKGIIHIQR